MKAIETRWKGWRFRSRTEARWAVFLEAMGIAFEYEPEGLALPSGPYLPDFRFQLHDLLWAVREGEDHYVEFTKNYWLEVKGQPPTREELQLLWEAARHTQSTGLLAIGAPDFRGQIYRLSGNLESLDRELFLHKYDGLATFAACSHREGVTLLYPDARPIPDPETGEEYPPADQLWLGHLQMPDGYDRTVGNWRPIASPRVRRAYDAARSARFEFGETDQRWSS